MKIINAKVFTPAFTFKNKDICLTHDKFSAESLDNLIVDAKGFYALGDGAGFTRSLSQAAANGLVVADILSKTIEL